MQIRASVTFYSKKYLKQTNALCVQNAEFINVVAGGTYFDMAPENLNIVNCKPVSLFMLENATEQ
jgi:hypothetical protein